MFHKLLTGYKCDEILCGNLRCSQSCCLIELCLYIRMAVFMEE